MKWTSEAEAAIRKVPVFAQIKVRQRVEREAAHSGKTEIGLEEVVASRRRYMEQMTTEIQGYQLDVCFGPGGCPNRAGISDGLLVAIDSVLKNEDLLSFLKSQINGELKFHHEFRVSIAECPNACSQPQIKDIGIIAVLSPRVTTVACSECRACETICPDKAVKIEYGKPFVDAGLCLMCGQCIGVCETGTIADGNWGYRVQVAGRLGRHPRLGRELPGIFNEAEVVEIVRACIELYKSRSRNGQRFADVFQEADYMEFTRRFGKPMGDPDDSSDDVPEEPVL